MHFNLNSKIPDYTSGKRHSGYFTQSGPNVVEFDTDPPSVGNTDSTTVVVSVPGAELGDIAVAGFTEDILGMQLTAYVSAPDTVTCAFYNTTGGFQDPGAGTLKVRVIKARTV